MALKQLVQTLAEALVDDPASVDVAEIEGDNNIILELRVAKNDIGKVIGKDGRTVAGFGKTYYWVGGHRVNLPSYVDTARTGHTHEGAFGDLCPVHLVTMSLTGVCDDC